MSEKCACGEIAQFEDKFLSDKGEVGRVEFTCRVITFLHGMIKP